MRLSISAWYKSTICNGRRNVEVEGDSEGEAEELKTLCQAVD